MTVKILADRLLAAKLVLPAPVVAYLASRPRPLAVGTSAELVPWTATHGYDAEQTRMLRKIVKGIVYSAAYSQSIVAGIHRQTFDGDDAGPPSEFRPELCPPGAARYGRQGQGSPAEGPAAG